MSDSKKQPLTPEELVGRREDTAPDSKKSSRCPLPSTGATRHIARFSNGLTATANTLRESRRGERTAHTADRHAKTSGNGEGESPAIPPRGNFLSYVGPSSFSSLPRFLRPTRQP